MKDEGQLLQEVLESATKKVENWPEWRRSDEARNQVAALETARAGHCGVLVVTGGRDYTDHVEVARRLGELRPKLLVQGGAAGLDALAALWAKNSEVSCLTMPARWRADGRGAGPRRNVRMLHFARGLAEYMQLPIAVAAFPGGKGTAHCVATARGLGITVLT